MASPASDAPARGKGLDWRNPGGKEYAVAAAGAVVLFLVYRWWKASHPSGAASTAGSDTGTGAPASPTGLSTSQFLAWIRDHQSSSTTTSDGGHRRHRRHVPEDNDRDEIIDHPIGDPIPAPRRHPVPEQRRG